MHNNRCTIFSLFVTLMGLACIIYFALPKSIPIVPRINIDHMIQSGYDKNGQELVTIKNNITLFENICSFWNTTNDIYYDKITLEFTSNAENYEQMVIITYSIIVIKFVLVFILFMIAGAAFSRSSVGNVIIMLSVLFLGTSVCLNLFALRQSVTFNNMLMVPNFDISGYSSSMHNENVVKFSDQDELFDLIVSNSTEYLHFTKCQKEDDIDLYQMFDLVFVLCSMICLVALSMMYVGKKYDPSRFDEYYTCLLYTSPSPRD